MHLHVHGSTNCLSGTSESPIRIVPVSGRSATRPTGAFVTASYPAGWRVRPGLPDRSVPVARWLPHVAVHLPRACRTRPMPWRRSLAEEYRLTVRNRSHLQNCGLNWTPREDGRKSRLRYRFHCEVFSVMRIKSLPPNGFHRLHLLVGAGGRKRVFEAARHNRGASARPRLQAPPHRRGRDGVVPQVWGSYRTWGAGGPAGTGTSRGGGLSPPLFDRAMPALDERPQEQGKDGGATGKAGRGVRRRAEALPERKGCRYADDFVGLVHGSRDDAENVRHEITEVLAPLT